VNRQKYILRQISCKCVLVGCPYTKSVGGGCRRELPLGGERWPELMGFRGGTFFDWWRVLRTRKAILFALVCDGFAWRIFFLHTCAVSSVVFDFVFLIADLALMTSVNFVDQFWHLSYRTTIFKSFFFAAIEGKFMILTHSILFNSQDRSRFIQTTLSTFRYVFHPSKGSFLIISSDHGVQRRAKLARKCA